jgi:uncharacterized protein
MQAPGTAHGTGPPVDAQAAVDPGPLALGAFALSTFILSFVNADLVDKTAIGGAIASAWIVGGLVQLLVGLWQLIRGRLFPAVAFTSYGGFWLSFAMYETVYAPHIPEAVRGDATAVFLAPWIVVTAYLLIASLKTNLVLTVGLAMLLALIIVLTIGQAQGSEGWIKFGGWLGLALAAEIWYLAAAELINQQFGRHLLPLWEFGPHPVTQPGPGAVHTT